MPQDITGEEVLHDVLRELVRLLVVLEAYPDQADTGRLECLSRRMTHYSVPISSELMDTVACIENLAVTVADLYEKRHGEVRYSWCGSEDDLIQAEFERYQREERN